MLGSTAQNINLANIKLEMNELARVTNAGETNEERSDILNLTNPTLASSDDYIEALYSLISSNYDRLTPIDGGQDLILALGEEEMRVEIGQNKTIKFENIEHLASLDPEDFLTMRLYTNQDAGNVLWEYAFELLNIFSTEDNDLNANLNGVWFVTADDPTVELASNIIGYINRDDTGNTPRSAKWEIDGGGSFEPAVITSQIGVFPTTLTMPTVAGSEGVVKVKLVDTSDVEAEWKKVIVLPGEPASIALTTSGNASVHGKGNLVLTATVKDSSGNTVMDGTTVRFYVNGHSYVKSFEEFTENGVATANLGGGYFTGNDNSVTVEVGLINKSTSFAVNGFNVSAPLLPTTVNINQIYNFDAVLSSGVGAEMEDVFVEAYTSHGRIGRSQLLTNVEGKQNLTWHAGSQPGTATILMKTAGNEVHKVTVNVVDPSAGSNSISTASQVLIADQAVDGSTDHTDLDGSSVPVSYITQGDITITGSANETKTVTIGSIDHPNRAPILSYLPSTAIDQNKLYHVSGKNISVAADHPSGIGLSTLLSHNDDTEQASRIEFNNSDSLQPSVPGATVLAKFDSAEPGELLNVSSGLRLTYTGSTLQATVATTNGDVSVSSGAVAQNTWSRIAVSTKDNMLRLSVNDVVSEVTLPDAVTFGTPENVLLADNLDVRIAAFDLFDNGISPLLLFSDTATESRPLTLDGMGNATVNVKSTGSLRQHDTSSQLNTAFVAVTDGNDSVTLTLSSEQQFSKVAGLLNDGLQTTPSFENVSALLADQSQYLDMGVVADKLIGTTADTDTYGQASALTTLLGSIELIRGTEKLQGLVRKMQTYYHNTAHQEIVLATVDVIGLAVKQALQGNRETLDQLVLPLTVMVELLESSPIAADYVASTVRSKEDLSQWYDFFKTPARGWVGLEPPLPELINDNCEVLHQNWAPGTAQEMSTTPCRLTGTKMATWIESLAMNDNHYLNDPHQFALFVKELNQNLPYSPMSIRRNLFETQTIDVASAMDFFVSKAYAAPQASVLLRPLKWLGKISSRASKNTWLFFMGKSNHRVNPLLMLYIFNYLNDRADPAIDCGDCKKLDFLKAQEKIRSKIDSVLKQIARAGYIKGDKYTDNGELVCGLAGVAHGEMFELMAIAYFHAVYEISGKENDKITGVERTNTIQIITKNKANEVKNVVKLRRRADIVLRGKGEDALKGDYIELNRSNR